jgi:hypothetical protein
MATGERQDKQKREAEDACIHRNRITSAAWAAF